ncbi:Ktr system potassium uptake protein B [Paenibacillus sp. CECT 9249]|uniref:TrkH family potassium uptake protein n=1 Tax=Paenibacillus sp. CECT 9249 TaxID=2845385 RepID=UPI001E3DDCBA|nr:TrkH family potassium uptake protein [Paenibacillus sp. CECT 9249]CAH0118217.1 Ktr system potassium uptake protein B [Paenibacillus sp. CECT 9249]
MRTNRKELRLSPPQILVLGFAAIITIGAFLLMLPISTRGDQPLSFIDALFTSTSATCVTGLVVVDTWSTFSIFGQIVIMILVQIGGLGFMTMATLFALVLKKRISLRERLILQESMRATSMEGIVRLIRRVIIFALTIESIAAVLFSIRWAFDMPPGKAVYYGIFHAVSLFNNGGFDLFGEFTSFQKYAADPYFHIIAMTLVVSGGLGFIVLADLYECPRRKKLSLQSKVVLSMTGILICVGTLVFFAFEYANAKTIGTMDLPGKILASFFQSVSTRSSGTSTVNIGDLHQGTQFFMIILMFIGAAPGSTGGGIKITTFALLVAGVVSMLRGRDDVVLFRNRIAKDLIIKALTIILFALFMVVAVAMLLSMTEDRSFLMILFETASAVGTVGLSMGLTPELSAFAKIVLCVAMFVGRLGPLTLAYALGPKKEKELYRHPEGKIIIG